MGNENWHYKRKVNDNWHYKRRKNRKYNIFGIIKNREDIFFSKMSTDIIVLHHICCMLAISALKIEIFFVDHFFFIQID
jgi:hypothetical protein